MLLFASFVSPCFILVCMQTIVPVCFVFLLSRVWFFDFLVIRDLVLAKPCREIFPALATCLPWPGICSDHIAVFAEGYWTLVDVTCGWVAKNWHLIQQDATPRKRAQPPQHPKHIV